MPATAKFGTDTTRVGLQLVEVPRTPSCLVNATRGEERLWVAAVVACPGARTAMPTKAVTGPGQ
ncbi:hypothetical protein [Streptosporangium sp. NPDC048865]|uniref:hypothetical protein n=1 Tax=Streptosporangium sp. NPDC048865 TaxID=3155766 RepID=UPI003440CBC9